MTSHLTSPFTFLVLFAFSLLSLAAALFMWISDDFVLNGQVVPATDARILVWRIALSVACIVFAGLTWLCLRQSPRTSLL
jgi:hypothetical protein